MPENNYVKIARKLGYQGAPDETDAEVIRNGAVLAYTKGDSKLSQEMRAEAERLEAAGGR